MIRRFTVCLLLGVLPAAASDAATLFHEIIQPALKVHCQGCHGAAQILGNLDLRTREAILTGGARGPAITPGNSAASLLYQALTAEGPRQMPPGGPAKCLPAATIAAFKTWIETGAPWPSAPTQSKRWNSKPEDLWAFQPLTKPAVPPSTAPNPIDAFLQRKLTQAQLTPAPRADRRTLIRRATLDLTGLPPTPQEVEAFASNNSPSAWPQLVERLLASPRYGERYARHWLDVTRYADTAGYSNDFERPNAWRYRDYVIRAFNQDKPYDQFIREQIAGDELAPTDPDALIATGFLRTGPWEHTAMSVEAATRQMFLDDVTHAVAATFLGVTLACARCHDHKFDPIPTKDFYRMQAVFATTEFARPPVPFRPDENTADLATGRAQMKRTVDEIKASVDSFDARVRANNLPADQYEELKLHQKHMQLFRESLDRYEPKAFAVSSGPLDNFTDGGPNLRYPPSAQYTPPDTYVLTGGNIQSPAEKVTPGVLSLIEPGANIPATVSGRRTALAQWIANPRNPLTARVMVNRIWQYHFGRAIAADPNNFGKMGRKPSHPELLDWLASDFIGKGWSVKALHRQIMLSEAYQRSSAHPQMQAVQTKDPGAALLAYYPPHRIEAETLRDAILAVSGELSLEAGGPGIFPQINEEVRKQPRHAMGSLQPAYQPSPLKRQRNRRTIYAFQQRSLIDPMVDVFNGPSLDLSCERRESSTVPTQAFALFNSQFVHDMSLALAARVDREPSATPAARIERAFRLIYARPPQPGEMQLALAHLARQTQHHRATPPPPIPPRKPLIHTITSELTGEKSSFLQRQDPGPYEENLHPRDAKPETRALADLALVLLNSNEFLFVY